MRVNRICSSYVNQKVSKNSNNKQNQPSFAAVKLPLAGEISDWFYKRVLCNGLKYRDEEAQNLVESLREYISTPFLSRKFIQKCKEERLIIYEKVALDIKEGHKPVDIGPKEYETKTPMLRYANQDEFDRMKHVYHNDRTPEEIEARAKKEMFESREPELGDEIDIMRL